MRRSFSGQSESWPDRGAPERSTAWWLVERWEALRLALGAHGHLAVRGGSIDPPQGVPNATPLAPPTAPSPRAGRARDCQTSDALRRENAPTRPSFRGARALTRANPESRCDRHNTSGFRVRA